MVTILNSPGGFGAQLGANLGTGVNAGLQYLLENKLKGLQSQKETENLIKQGVPAQIAHLLPSLDDQGKKALWDKFNFNNLLSANPAQPNAQQGGQFGNMMQALGSQQNQQPGLMQNQPNPVQSSMQNQPLNNMAAIPADIPQEILDNVSKQLGIPRDKIQQLLQSQQQPSAQNQSATQNNQPWFTTKGGSASSVEEGQKIQIKEAQAKAQEVIEKGAIAQRNIKILDEYEHILKTGNISYGTTHALGKFTGTAGDITTDDTQVLAKLSEQLVPPARTDAELRSFQNRVPNPSQSKNAQLRLVKTLREDLKNDVKQARIANDIISKNGGVAPIGFDRMISSKSGIKELENTVSQAPEGYQAIGDFTELSQVKAQEGDILESSDGKKYKFSQGKFIKES